jgi:CspA family cold shock protein
MPSGVIRRLVRDRGLGFIKGDDEQDLFSHLSDLRDATFELLKEGQSVEFEKGESPKGPKAVKIKLIQKGDQGCFRERNKPKGRLQRQSQK